MYQVCFENCFCIGYGNNETEVFLGLGTDGLEVAVKRLKLKFCTFAENEKRIMNLQRLVENPNVLNYRFHFQNKQYAYIVTDLQEESLKQFVHSNEVDKLQNEGPTILKEILLGIDALHADNILHRDLKPENVLVNFEGTMVLADFGICRRLQPDQTTHESVIRGTDKWRALESIPTDDDYKQQFLTVRYKKKSDVQVLGMLFYFLLTKGKHPFGKWGFEILSNIKIGESKLTELTDPVAKDLIEWMIEHDITERPTVKQSLKHPYLKLPEVNFKFITAVGNEMEIKINDSNSIVVQKLNYEASLTTPPWWEKVDRKIYNYFTRPGFGYSNNGVELLRFMRNATTHWPAPFLETFGTPQAYFFQVFPTLPMIVHKILRKYPDWCRRETLKQFF